MPGAELRIQLQRHPSGLWIGVPIKIAGIADMLFIVDSGAPVSAVSVEALHDLAMRGLLARTDDPRYYRLLSLSADGQPLPDLAVRALPRLTRLRVDGLIGLDYLTQFRRVCFHVDEGMLVLE